jgi:hypothetical protein
MERQKHAGSSPARDRRSNTMAEKVALWEPTEYKSLYIHCGTTNFSKTPSAQHLCIECNKEYMATVAHTEED